MIVRTNVVRNSIICVPIAALFSPYVTFPSNSFSGTFMSIPTCWIVTFKWSSMSAKYYGDISIYLLPRKRKRFRINLYLNLCLNLCQASLLYSKLTLGSLYHVQQPPWLVKLVFWQLLPREGHHSPWYQTFSGTLLTKEIARPILSALPTLPMRCT